MLNHFNFKRLSDGSFVITNDFGRYSFLSAEDFRLLVSGKLESNGPTYEELRRGGFVLEEADLYSDYVRDMLRNAKRYVFNASSLHIFVMTSACNLQCEYCQAKTGTMSGKSMSIETAKKAVEIALQSPSNNLTFEFQGGEPLLNYATIREVVLHAERMKGEKSVSFSLVSNLSLLADEMLEFFIEHNVSISTSLDGPKALHDCNRPHRNGLSSYELMLAGLRKVQGKHYPLSAIETTTRASLAFAKDVVKEYVRLGFGGVFIRPLTPLGMASSKWEDIGYTPDEFLNFYRSALEEILSVNKRGLCFPEQTAAILLRKILRNDGINFMDLRSPCGAGFGQLAYVPNGDVYTCDEARMVAEAGDFSFRLGNVYTHSYKDVVSCDVCTAVCSASVAETLPGCCDCVYQPYCGVCPVVNYAGCGDIFPKGPAGYRCKVYGGILDILFELLHENDLSTVGVLESWL